MKYVGAVLVVFVKLFVFVKGNKTCGVGEVLTRCVNPCAPTCEDPNPPICNFLVCNEGCVCQDPLIRNAATGKCVERKYCPVSCNDENAVRTDCAPKCPQTCQNSYFGRCSKQCAPGCVCKEGYIKDEISGKCVSIETCKRLKCDRHEKYKQCGPLCSKTCAFQDDEICVGECRPGCFCKDGYVRYEKTGECIKPDQCPKCGKNETYVSRGRDCPTCSNREVCDPQNEYKCYCLLGYIRNDNGTCVLPEDCPDKLCKKPHEYYTFCDPGPCEPTCQHTEQIPCIPNCKFSGCRCDNGYLRDNRTRECVPEGQCS